MNLPEAPEPWMWRGVAALGAAVAVLAVTALGVVPVVVGLIAAVALVGAGAWLLRHHVEVREAQVEWGRGLARQAWTDPLTGISNRLDFFAALERTLSSKEAGSPGWAVLMIDMDRFKAVNDGYGHHVGDQMLVEVSRRLRGVVRPDDLLARLGGDEFVIAFPLASTSALAVLRQRLDQVVDVLRGPYRIDDESIESWGSVGVATSPVDGVTVDDLMRRADLAMYRAKRSRSGWALFERALEVGDIGPDGLAEDLAEAIEKDQLTVKFQPQVEARSGRVVGVEALVRWTHPVRGEVSPSEFVRVAERTGQIQGLSTIVLRQALGWARAWKLAGHDLAVTVNLSVLDVDRHLGGKVRRLLDDFGLAPTDLAVEMSETGILRDLEVTRSVFTELDGIGVVVALDDFSGGRSALAGLTNLPLRLLKVGRAFVGGMIADQRHAAVVRGSIELGHELGLGVVAVGVESQAIRQALVDLGCDQLQGFSICPPLSAGELLAWLDEHQAISLEPSAEAPSRGPVIDVTGTVADQPDAPAV